MGGYRGTRAAYRRPHRGHRGSRGLHQVDTVFKGDCDLDRLGLFTRRDGHTKELTHLIGARVRVRARVRARARVRLRARLRARVRVRARLRVRK